MRAIITQIALKLVLLNVMVVLVSNVQLIMIVLIFLVQNISYMYYFHSLIYIIKVEKHVEMVFALNVTKVFNNKKKNIIVFLLQK